MSKRFKTKYVGIFYRKTQRIGSQGLEKVFYLIFKKDGKVFEEKAGRQYSDNMTAPKAARIRAERIDGKRLSRKELREKEKALKDAEAGRWTIEKLWQSYKKNNPGLKGMVTDENRFTNYIKPYFGDKEPQNILPLDVDRLRLNLLKTKAPGTVRNVLEILRRLVNYGINKRLCEGTSFKIQLPQVNNLKTEDLTSEQLESLLKAIDQDTHPHAGAMMKLILFSGLRRTECFKLRWKDIDFDRGFINIRDPKGGKDQFFPLSDGAQEVLKGHIKTDSPFVFTGRGGRQRTDIKKQVNRIKTKAGLPKDFRPLHGLRHVYASMLASSGEVDLYTLQRLLTHKSPLMSMRYAHLRNETLKKAANVASDIITEAMNTKEKVAQIKERKEK